MNLHDFGFTWDFVSELEILGQLDNDSHYKFAKFQKKPLKVVLLSNLLNQLKSIIVKLALL